MRVNLKCDKSYNSNHSNIISSGWVNSRVIEDAVGRFAYLKNNKVNIDITEAFVDFYNINSNDIKSAQSLARYLRRQWVSNFGDKLFNQKG